MAKRSNLSLAEQLERTRLRLASEELLYDQLRDLPPEIEQAYLDHCTALDDYLFHELKALRIDVLIMIGEHLCYQLPGTPSHRRNHYLDLINRWYREGKVYFINYDKGRFVIIKEVV